MVLCGKENTLESTPPECEFQPCHDRQTFAELFNLSLPQLYLHNGDDSIVTVLTILMCLRINICKAFENSA